MLNLFYQIATDEMRGGPRLCVHVEVHRCLVQYRNRSSYTFFTNLYIHPCELPAMMATDGGHVQSSFSHDGSSEAGRLRGVCVRFNPMGEAPTLVSHAGSSFWYLLFALYRPINGVLSIVIVFSPIVV